MPMTGPMGAPWNGGATFSLGACSSAAAVKSFGVFSTDNIKTLLAEITYLVNSTTTAASAALFGMVASGQRYLAAASPLNNAQGAAVFLADLFPASGSANFAAWPWPLAEVQVSVGSGSLTPSLGTFAKGIYNASY